MRSGVVIRLSFVRAKQEGQFLNSRFLPSHRTDQVYGTENR